VRERSSLPTGFGLGASLEPQLTDSVVAMSTLHIASPINAEVPLFEFYSVAPVAFQLNRNRLMGQSARVDNESEWLVAFDCQTDKAFLLEGSSDPVAAFNSLIQRIGLSVTTPQNALDVFDFFLTVAYGQRFRSQVVGDDMHLESVALEDFRSRLPERRRRAAFDAWWSRLSPATKKGVAAPLARPMKGGFSVRYFFYSQGTVWRRTAAVTADGAVSEASPQVIDGLARSTAAESQAQFAFLWSARTSLADLVN